MISDSQAYATGTNNMTEVCMQRLDKFLSEAGVASRKELKQLIRSGAVCVDGAVQREPEAKLDEKTAQVTVNGEAVTGFHTLTVMLHKPAGYVTAAEDPKERTVMELLPPEIRQLNVMPVGRLDKLTEGLLLFTNDGALAHRLISPKYEVNKVYYAEHEGTASEEDVKAFAAGLVLRDGTACRPAELQIISAGKCCVTVHEGKYHQVRRMLASRGLPVTYLRREREGGLQLGDLPLGAYRVLGENEIAMLL